MGREKRIPVTEISYELLKRLSYNPCGSCNKCIGCCGCQKRKDYDEAVEKYRNSDIYEAATAVQLVNTLGNEMETMQNVMKEECSYLRELGFDLSKVFGPETGYSSTGKREQHAGGTIHRLKLLHTFADDIFNGNKSFEVRYNDRNYKKGDFIRFSVIDGNGMKLSHPLNSILFKITYVLDGWGLKNGYVALGIERFCEFGKEG